MSNIQLRQDMPTRAAAITTSNTVANEFSLIYVGGAGNVKVQTEEGVDVTFTAVPVGQYIPCRTRLVYATGTTATNLVGLG